MRMVRGKAVLEKDKPRAVEDRRGANRGPRSTSRNRDCRQRATGVTSWQCATMWRPGLLRPGRRRPVPQMRGSGRAGSANTEFAVVSLIHSAVCWLRYASEIPHEKAGDATPGIGHRSGPC